MDRHGCNHTRSAQQAVGQGLPRKVVDSDGVLGGHKEEGLGWVEQHARHPAAIPAEGVLRGSLAQLVHQHSLCVPCAPQQNVRPACSLYGFSGSSCSLITYGMRACKLRAYSCWFSAGDAVQ